MCTSHFMKQLCVCAYIHLPNIPYISPFLSFLPIAVVYVTKTFLYCDTLFREQNVRHCCGMIGAVIFPEK